MPKKKKKKVNICNSNNWKIGFSSGPAFIKEKSDPVIFITLIINQTTHQFLLEMFNQGFKIIRVAPGTCSTLGCAEGIFWRVLSLPLLICSKKNTFTGVAAKGWIWKHCLLQPDTRRCNIVYFCIKVTQMKNNLPHMDTDMTRLCHLGQMPRKWGLIAPSCLLWRMDL